MMKRMWKRATRYHTFWMPLILAVFTIVIFSWFFWDKLWIRMNQDALRNLILLTAGVVGWYFLYQRTKTADQSKKAAEQSAEATRKNAITAENGLTAERLTRAIEQIAHEDASVRLGGILGLEQIADVHEEERYKIARVFVSFIRNQAAKNSERAKKDYTESGVLKLEDEEEFSAYRAQRLDIEAAVNTLANIALGLDKQEQFKEQYNEKKQHLCDLRKTDLRGLRFVRSQFV